MTRPRVWAPDAGRVALVTGGTATPLTRADGGWWTATLDLAPGDDYAFAVDGGAPAPDPRSRWQPAGVHGPSRVVGDGFPWTDASWRCPDLAAAVLYELHIGTFTPAGTFAGAIGRLSDLVALGVTAVEVMPTAAFPGRHGWGYDSVDLYAVHEPYGGPDAFRRFVDAAHGHGLAVVLDVVYNHVGPDGNYLAAFGPYFTDRYRTPWGAAMNFDGRGGEGVREFVIDNARMWRREYHVDALRLDSVHALHDASPVHVLAQLAEAFDGWLIAESDRVDPRLVRGRAENGYGLTAQWSDAFPRALEPVLTGGPGTAAALAGVGEVLAGRDSGAHDAATRVVSYLQNHDQVADRPGGTRLSQRTIPARLRVGAALLLTMPFVPMLFQGEEWAAATPFGYFTDHTDPALGRAVRDGRRRKLASLGIAARDVPDPQDPSTFTRSILCWDERATEPHASMLAWYRDLIALRHRTPELRDGTYAETRVDSAAGSLITEYGPLAVACNLGAEAVGVAVDGDLVLVSDDAIDWKRGRAVLPPDTVALLAR